MSLITFSFPSILRSAIPTSPPPTRPISFPQIRTSFRYNSKPLSFQPIRASTNQNHKRTSRSHVPNKNVPIAISLAIGLAIRFAVPRPHEVSTQAWQLLSIFAATNVGLILSPLPIGAWAFLALTVSIASKTLTFSDAFRGFSSEVIWLIVCSYFIARGFVKTGLGDRVATYFVKWFGKSDLGLAYGLTFGETFVSMVMPSSIARAGGLFLPMIKSILSLSNVGGGDGKSVRKLGAFLVMAQLHSAGNSSALFLTASANNLLMFKLAGDIGIKIANPWVSWFTAASLPAFISLLITPLVLYMVFPPEKGGEVDASAIARERLKQMGPVSENEQFMIGTMLFVVSLWVFGAAVGVPTVVPALLGLSVLLLRGVVTWDDCLSEKSAWDTFMWFAVLAGMASQLSDLGIVAWLSDCVAKSLQSFSLSWIMTFAILQAAYFFIHYIFASQVAHVGALYSSFLAMHLAYGVPSVLAALTLAFNTNLFGALTHYSSAPAAAYFGETRRYQGIILWKAKVDAFQNPFTAASWHALYYAKVDELKHLAERKIVKNQTYFTENQMATKVRQILGRNPGKDEWK
ncbi:hypothetical protein Sjap_010609 [Stephania japonica]|uniref:Sodium/sulfate symporter n=1 Tax=Stephania japonica TaxID=461633 RepID=A0AAP0J9G4_9MAGN